MELIDVYDENGNLTGEKATIKELHRNGKWHKVVGIIIYDSNNNILMQQRALNEKSDAGKWDITAAGHIDTGENSIHAILRELNEEVGIQLSEKDIDFFLFYKKEVHNERVNKKHLEDIYIAKIDNIDISKLKIQKEEVNQIKLFSINEIKDLVYNNKVKTRDEMYKKLFDIFS